MFAFLSTAFLSGCSYHFVAAALHCRALVSQELLICSPGSLAVLHEHCAMLRPPVCAPPGPHTDCLPSMQAGTAMALCSDVDPLHIAPSTSEPGQSFPSARGLSHSGTHGVSLLNQVLVTAGPAHLPPGSILQSCQPLPDSTLWGSRSAPLTWGKDDHHWSTALPWACA